MQEEAKTSSAGSEEDIGWHPKVVSQINQVGETHIMNEPTEAAMASGQASTGVSLTKLTESV